MDICNTGGNTRPSTIDLGISFQPSKEVIHLRMCHPQSADSGKKRPAICKQCGDGATSTRITPQHVLSLTTLHGWPTYHRPSTYAVNLTQFIVQTPVTTLQISYSYPRALTISPVGAGESIAMAYKRGILVFIFLLSAYSVFHFSSEHAESGFVHKMKRSMVGDIRSVNMKLVHG